MDAPQIYKTTDYSLFGDIIGNRNINDKKVQSIKNDVTNGLNLLPYVPIIVYPDNDLLLIVDGQHRFTVSVELKEPVYYVITEKLTLRQMAMINNRQDKWKPHDFLRCYIKIGIEDYKILKDVMDEFCIGISTGIDLLMFSKISKQGKSSQIFRDGNFKIKYYDQTIELLKLSHKIFNRYKFYTDRNLITAVQEIKEKGLCDFEVLETKVHQNPMLMNKQDSIKDYIYNIEKVYNHKNQNRQIIF